MNVTRDVITDLLPVYFSGEASDDTKQLVEGYFHGDPDFERIARRSATPLEILRDAAPRPPDAVRETCDLQRVAWEVRTRKVWLVMALYYTFLPFLPLVSTQLASWVGGPHTLGGRIVDWTAAIFFWILYVLRMSRRNVTLAVALVVTAGELALIFNKLHLINDQAAHATRPEIVGIAIGAAFFWVWYLRQRAPARTPADNAVSNHRSGFRKRRNRRREPS
ncbi:MAG TPA: hypothetical protein VFW94_01195 [Candidatus Acidoferrales bacterium]|nr:hypothetical protein [Candidatus Acidoferrales bacterium]